MPTMTTSTSTCRVGRSTPSIGLAILSVAAFACSSGEPAAGGTGPSTSSPETIDSTPPDADVAPTTHSTTAPTSAGSTSTPTTTVPMTRSIPPIPLGDDDRVFYAGSSTVVVAHAPAPWEPFPVSSLGMRRDLGTAEWVGISFWEPWEVAMDPCRWEDSWVDAGETVVELADALVAVEGRNATAPVPVTVGGYQGLYLEWSLPDDLDFTRCDDESTVAWTGALQKTRSQDTPGVTDRIWILDVEGSRMLIDAISLPFAQELTRPRVDEVIDSLRLAANE